MCKVVYLFPQIGLSPGGIQILNEDTLSVLTQTWPRARHRVLLYVNHDVPPMPAGVAGDVRLIPCGMPSKHLAKARLALVFAWLVLVRPPDLIIVGHVGLGPLAWVAKRVLRIPYVVWAHGTEVWHQCRGIHVASLRLADRVVAVSRYTARELGAIDASLPDRTVVVHPMVDSQFRPGRGEALRRRLGVNDARVLLSVGRLSATDRYKGFDTVLRALPEVLARAPDVRYIVAGEGDDLPRLRALADRLGVSHATVFTGSPSDRDLPDYYNACELFVMPSSKEGFGIVFIEALACGKPVIAGDAGGAPDAVLDGGLGRLVQPGDVQGLARVALDFLEDRWPAALTAPERLHRECVKHFGTAAFQRGVQAVVGSLASRCGSGETVGRP